MDEQLEQKWYVGPLVFLSSVVTVTTAVTEAVTVTATAL